MITGIRITSVEARREKDEDIKGLDINIGIDNVKVTGPEVEVYFAYTATYQPGVGILRMTGSLLSHEEPALAAEIWSEWDKDVRQPTGEMGKQRKLPDAYSELVLNAVNFTCGTNGVLVVRPVNLAPPMIPPRIELGPGGGGTPGAATSARVGGTAGRTPPPTVPARSGRPPRGS